MRKVYKYPEYKRTPHFDSSISNMTHDDILYEGDIQFPLDCYVQEKLDGANMRISWSDGPVVGNRKHILKKGFIKTKTPAKRQFTYAWNWIHLHKKDIQRAFEIWGGYLTIYGEWCYYTHSISYDRLPDFFIAYDIYSHDDQKYLSPDVVKNILSQTNIKYIEPTKIVFNSVKDIIELSEMNSLYKDGYCEGIVIKIPDGTFYTESFKIVNKFFIRRNNFNNSCIIKNKLLYL